MIEDHRTETMLRESERRFREAFAHAPLAMAHAAPDGRWLRVNPRFCQLLGYTERELIERTFMDVTHPDDVGADRAQLRRLAAGEIPAYSQAKRYVHKDGTFVWARVTVSAVRHDDGSPEYFVDVIEDITRERQHEDLRRFLADASLALAGTLDEQEALDQLATVATVRLADLCVVDLVDGGGVPRRVILRHRDPAKQQLMREYADAAHGPSHPQSPATAVLRTGTAMLVPEIDTLVAAARDVRERDAAVLRDVAPRSLMVAPLASRGRTLGVITLGITEPGRRYGREDLAALETFARWAALAIDNSRLYEAAREAQRTAEAQAEAMEDQAAELEAANQELTEAVVAEEEAKEAAEAANARNQALLGAMRDVVLVLDADGYFVDVPDTSADPRYRPSADLTGRRLGDVLPADEAARWLATVDRALLSHDTVRADYSIEAGGETVHFSALVSPLGPDRVLWVARDVTAERQSAEALRASEDRYRLLFESNPMPMWLFDPRTLRFITVNEAAVKGYGYTREEFAGMSILDIRPEDDWERLRAAVANAPPTLRQTTGWRHRRKDGTLIDVEIAAHPLSIDGHDAQLVLVRDVTDRTRAEAALRETTDLLRASIDESPLAIVTMDHGLDVTRWNRAATRLLGYSAEEMQHRSYLTVIPEDRRREFDRARERAQRGEGVSNIETQQARKDGSLVDVNVSLAALHDSTGAPRGFIVVLADMTEQRQLEDQLRQAQKMEAVGRLAGGIAHDFNNLLTVITSYTALAMTALPPESDERSDLEEVMKASNRAAGLTRQLLAFSRRQVLQPKVVNLNDIVLDVQRMLERVIGEDVQLVTSLNPRLDLVHADPGQIEQVLMNLSVNARDAMPSGGRLLIETSNVQLDEAAAGQIKETRVGSYVLLTVTDTGVGMDRATQERIFEPFFTTKEIGKGTGLGLSTVYGIVRQSGGSISVHSEPGAGTTFRIYLPRHGATWITGETRAARKAPPERHGTVLLVEDEDSVRRVVRLALQRRGLTVLEASSGEAALELMHSHGAPIDLVISDMVMPGMRGGALAAEVRARWPGTKVLLMSGYTEEMIGPSDALPPGVGFVAKPFTPETLAVAVEGALNAG